MSLEFLPDSRTCETGAEGDFVANLILFSTLEPHLK